MEGDAEKVISGLVAASLMSAEHSSLPPYPFAMDSITTPDGRYLIVRGRLWRTTNPGLSEQERQRLVDELMDARRAVKAAKASGDPDDLTTARQAVDNAKRGLGERGAVWWSDGAPDLNRHLAKNTQYAGWWAQVDQAEKD